MKREYSIETNERKIYPLGVTKTPGGFDVAFVSEKSPALLLFEKGSRKPLFKGNYMCYDNVVFKTTLYIFFDELL